MLENKSALQSSGPRPQASRTFSLSLPLSLSPCLQPTSLLSNPNHNQVAWTGIMASPFAHSFPEYLSWDRLKLQKEVDHIGWNWEGGKTTTKKNSAERIYT